MSGIPSPSPSDLADLARRLGPERLKKRLAREQLLWRKKSALRTGFRGNIANAGQWAAFILRATGLWRTANAAFRDVRLKTNYVILNGLPAAFHGFRLLQLSDLHCDLDPGLIDVVERLIESLDHDAAVLTGDYQDRITADDGVALGLMKRLIPKLRTPRFGILGNHDLLAGVSALERAGLPILLNEAIPIMRDGGELWICGIDDPRFFQTHDPAAARRGVPTGGTTILLSHAPDTWLQAAELDYDLLLAGHTHGGQICLPGGLIIARNSRAPSNLLAGPWRYKNMQGYTSRGTGACGVAARLFCPAEITMHILRRA